MEYTYIDQSESINELIGALVKAQMKIHHAHKDSKNPHFKSSFASLEAVIDATKEALLSQELVVLQQPIREDGKNILMTTLAHGSGQWIRSFTEIINLKGDPQSMGSGLTYARRYALAAMLCIGQEDDDGNKATEKPKSGAAEGPAPKSLQEQKKAMDQFYAEQLMSSVNVYPQAKESDKLGDYEITFGKFKGATLGDLEQSEIRGFLSWLQAEAAKLNKPLTGKAKEFEMAARAYLEEVF